MGPDPLAGAKSGGFSVSHTANPPDLGRKSSGAIHPDSGSSFCDSLICAKDDQPLSSGVAEGNPLRFHLSGHYDDYIGTNSHHRGIARGS